MKRGGYAVVQEQSRAWEEIAEELRIQNVSPEVLDQLRQVYCQTIRSSEQKLVSRFPVESFPPETCGQPDLHETRECDQQAVLENARPQAEQKECENLRTPKIQTQSSDCKERPCFKSESNTPLKHRPLIRKITGSSKRIKISQAPVSDKQLQQLINANPSLQTLEIDSLQNITAIPDQIPRTLRDVTLRNVPQGLVVPFILQLSEIGVDCIDVTGCSEAGKEAQNAEPAQQMRSLSQSEQFRREMIRHLRRRMGSSEQISDDATDEGLCDLYEALSPEQKNNFWRDVGRGMGIDGKETCGMYKRMYNRIKFPDKLTENDKLYIDRYVHNNSRIMSDQNIKAELHAYF